MLLLHLICNIYITMISRFYEIMYYIAYIVRLTLVVILNKYYKHIILSYRNIYIEFLLNINIERNFY